MIEQKNNKSGVIYVVATPIGNLNDISSRALEILSEVDFIAAEDTRVSKQLLRYYHINTPLVPLHEHNERAQTLKLLTRVAKGESMALISDAGTPLVSDPGVYLLGQAQAQGMTVSPIPGACAAIAALSCAGLPAQRFVFEGFLPTRSGQRQTRLKLLSIETRTLIFYEAPHRIVATLSDMAAIFGLERYAVIARELTKLYETVHGDRLGNIITWLTENTEQQKGEFVVLVAGFNSDIGENVRMRGQEDGLLHLPLEELLAKLLAELSLKKAVMLATNISGQRKNDVYKMALQMRG